MYPKKNHFRLHTTPRVCTHTGPVSQTLIAVYRCLAPHTHTAYLANQCHCACMCLCDLATPHSAPENKHQPNVTDGDSPQSTSKHTQANTKKTCYPHPLDRAFHGISSPASHSEHRNANQPYTFRPVRSFKLTWPLWRPQSRRSENPLTRNVRIGRAVANGRLGGGWGARKGRVAFLRRRRTRT